ncbi:hypothetical protein OA77_21155, partial [Pseudomonas coronafaciens]
TSRATSTATKKIVDLFRPQIEQQDKAFSAKVDKNFATVDKILAKYKTKDVGSRLTTRSGKRPQSPDRSGQYLGRRPLHPARQAGFELI